jgi:hypothetical protein
MVWPLALVVVGDMEDGRGRKCGQLYYQLISFCWSRAAGFSLASFAS